jgi:hypothetical protein
MNTSSLKKYSIITAVLMLFIITGCKKFLDQQPITEVGPEMAFKDVEGAFQALVGVYSRLAGQEGYGQRLSLYFTVDTDEAQGPTGASDNDRRDIARYAATSGNAQINNPFNQIFQGIEYANVVIENIPKMNLYTNGSEMEKRKLQRMHGEALTLRAQFYFEAIRNWGDLPSHFSSAATQALTDPFPGKVDRDTLYNRILADLGTATNLVPWRDELSSIGESADERITKGTVKGLRARIALFRGGYSLRSDGQMKRSADYLTYYEMARKETSEIIASGKHSLNPSFRGLWKDQVNARTSADPNGELMFQVASVGNTLAADSRLGFYNGPRLGTLGNAAINPLPTYFYLFDSTDTRRDVTIAAYNINANGTTKIGLPLTQLNDGKFRRDWITNPTPSTTSAVQFLGLKWQILRYPDVLLMFAEAENEISGPTSEAYSALNMVRRRGFGKAINTPDPSVDLSGLSKTDFFKAIVRERSLELGGEGVRKYDLIRWNLLGTALNETKANLLKLSERAAMNPVTYMLPQPVYSRTTTLPQFMYYINNSTADDARLWANSFYRASATTASPTRVNWVRAEVNTASNARFATGYTPGKSELLPFPNSARQANPKLTQNPGYL